MVTGTTDNGGCMLSEEGSQGWAACRASRRARLRADADAAAAARWRVGDLRKTARGASSPAKPALHIPELSIVSSYPSSVHHSRVPVAGGAAR